MAKLIQEKDVKKEMQQIGADAWAVEYMLDKSKFRIIKVENVRNAIANILKQEMLSIGGDVAVNKGCVNCSVEKSDVLIMGTVRQIRKLINKMDNQVSESTDIAEEIKEILDRLC
jgi:dihydropteroate synthase